MGEYEIEINGVPHTLQLSDEDATRYGAVATLVQSKAKTPPNKSKTPRNKAS